MNISKTFLKLAVAISSAAIFYACEPEWDTDISISHHPGEPENPGDRIENIERRNVMLLYSAGFNNLSGYLLSNLAEINEGWLPGQGRNKNVLLIYSHHLAPGAGYDTPNSPVLYRLSRSYNDEIICDTLAVYEAGTNSTDPAQLNKVLTFVRDEFPAKSYGMVFSSHSTGYLPNGYYNNPDDYIFDGAERSRRSGIFRKPKAFEYRERTDDPYANLVKSLGQHREGNLSYEMDITDFADAIPMHMDYLLFDACLMGGIEGAYELKDKCRLYGGSPTEVLAAGFDYTSIVGHLLGDSEPDVESVCRDYFNRYDIQTGISRSATITLIDCTRLDPVADVCSGLFEKYHINLANMSPYGVQRYFRYDYHWFYDMVDIVKNAGATEEEVRNLNDRLQECIVYKNATPEFLESSGGFKIETYCGVSMYLPADGEKELDKFYKTLSWNQDTGLVR